MNLKVSLKLKTPFIYKPTTPLDGTLSFLLALKRGFYREGQEGTFKWGALELPLHKYGYILDLTDLIETTPVKRGFLFKVSVLFSSGAKERESRIFRKTPEFSEAFRESSLYKRNFIEMMGSGKMRAIVRPIRVIEADWVWFYASVKEGKEEEFAELVELFRVSGIGKKTGHGYGQVEDIIVEEAEGEFDGLFVEREGGRVPARPLPDELVGEGGFYSTQDIYPLKVYTSTLPPYYLPVDNRECTFVYPFPIFGKEVKDEV